MQVHGGVKNLREGDNTVFGAFCVVHVNTLIAKVEVFDPQLERLHQPQPRAVQ